MSGFLTNKTAMMNISPLCCRTAVFLVHCLHFPATVGYNIVFCNAQKVQEMAVKVHQRCTDV